jgi:hypothetical protein
MLQVSSPSSTRPFIKVHPQPTQNFRPPRSARRIHQSHTLTHATSVLLALTRLINQSPSPSTSKFSPASLRSAHSSKPHPHKCYKCPHRHPLVRSSKSIPIDLEIFARLAPLGAFIKATPSQMPKIPTKCQRAQDRKISSRAQAQNPAFSPATFRRPQYN